MRWRGIQSQNQLARISGVPQSCIHRILTRADGYSPSRGTLLRLAEALETGVPWLTDGVVSTSDPHSVPPGYGALPADTHASEHAATQPALQTALPAALPPALPPARQATPEMDGYCAEISVLLRSQPENIKKTVLSMVRLVVENRRARARAPDY